MQRYQHYIEGRNVDPDSGKWFDSFNPYTGEPWSQTAQGNAADVDRAVRAAHRAFTGGPWSQMSASERGLLLHRFGDLVARDAKRLAEIEMRDNGKLIAEMQGQLNYIPQWYYYFGGLADKIQGRSCRSIRRAISTSPATCRSVSSASSRRGTRPCSYSRASSLPRLPPVAPR